MHTTGTVIVLATAAVILAGCTADVQDPDAQASAASVPPGTPAPWPTEVAPLPTASGTVVDEDTGATYGPVDTPAWDPASRRAAEKAAAGVLAAFADTGRGRDAWWAEVEPRLTQLAAQDYAYVDPETVPVSRVTGDATIVEDSSAWTARVEVPTDIGPYVVTVVREDGSAPWLADRLTPPAE